MSTEPITNEWPIAAESLYRDDVLVTQVWRSARNPFAAALRELVAQAAIGAAAAPLIEAAKAWRDYMMGERDERLTDDSPNVVAALLGAIESHRVAAGSLSEGPQADG